MGFLSGNWIKTLPYTLATNLSFVPFGNVAVSLLASPVENQIIAATIARAANVAPTSQRLSLGKLKCAICMENIELVDGHNADVSVGVMLIEPTIAKNRVNEKVDEKLRARAR